MNAEFLMAVMKDMEEGRKEIAEVREFWKDFGERLLTHPQAYALLLAGFGPDLLKRLAKVKKTSLSFTVTMEIIIALAEKNMNEMMSEVSEEA